MASPTAATGLLLFTSFLLPFCAAQVTCRGRCGELFSRGRVCHCDHSCLSHKECCPDYESTCITGDSCVGRCGEAFKRGRLCHCDPNCALYSQCCSDFQAQCAAETAIRTITTPVPNTAERRTSHADANKNRAKELPKKQPLKKPVLKLLSSSPISPDSESEERYPVHSKLMNTFPPPTQHPEILPPPTVDTLITLSQDGEGRYDLVQAAGPSPNTPHLFQPAAPDGGSTLHMIPVATETVLLGSTGQQLVPAGPRLDQLAPEQLVPSSGKPTTNSLDIVVSAVKPAGNPTRPGTPVDSIVSVDNSSDTDLCDLQPISGVTVLFNGTILVFRGDFFWLLDVSWAPSPARRIGEVWGVPSPIDAIFTRSNCQGKTYIFKGNNCWRFENDVLDPGYPKSISVEFKGFGLSGEIVAALPVPATRRRPESVYFFKRGGLVQKFSFEPGATPTCGKKFPVFAREKQPAEQAASPSKEINIKLSWKGFPSPVTSAVSIPNPDKSDGYEYYIFSNDKYYNIKIVGERLALASTPPQAFRDSSVHQWLRCPEATR
ncbi:proteoglycan 4-like isoform X1 [Arapaima gigas]